MRIFKNISLLWWGLFIVVFTYQLLGIYPISLFEGDGIFIAVGVNTFDLQGIGGNPLTYRYSSQSFTYFLIYFFSNLLGQPPFKIFSILSAAAALGYILVSTGLIHKTTGIPYPICGLVMVSFQEGFTTAYYPNSNAIAAFLVVTGLALFFGANALNPTFYDEVTQGRRFGRFSTNYKVLLSSLSGIFIAFGIFARLDAFILLVPCCLMFLICKSKPPKQGMQALVSFWTASFLLAIFLKVDFTSAAKNASEHFVNGYYLALILKSYASFFSLLNIFMICIGIYYLFTQKLHRILLTSLIGVLPLILLYSKTMTTPKYLLYTLPYWSLLATFSIKSFYSFNSSKKKLMLAIIILLTITQYIIAIRIISPKPSKSYLSFIVEKPHILQIQLYNNQFKANVGIGPGQPLFTHDKYRLISGIYFFPSFWKEIKQFQNTKIDQLCRQIDPNINYSTTTDAESVSALIYCAQEKGFSCTKLENIPSAQFSCQTDYATLMLSVNNK